VLQGRGGGWFAGVVGTWLLKPFTLGRRLREERLARRRLAEALAHRRVKDDQIRRRLAQLEAERDAQADEAQSLFEALVTERRPLRLDDAYAARWSAAAARARRQVQALAAALDQARAADETPAAGALPGAATAPKVRPGPAEAADCAPVRLAIAGRAPTAFSMVSDPRLIARHVGDPLVEAADAVVFPHAEVGDYLEDARHVADAQWERVRRGLATIVFDASSEGFPHTAAESLRLRAFLAAHGAEPSRALYVTQDRRYAADQEAWCAAEGAPPMRTWVFDAYIYRVLREFVRIGPRVFEHRLAEYLKRPAERPRRFVCLNYTLRPLKALFLLGLMRDGLWDHGWISSGGFAEGPDEEIFTRQALTNRLRAIPGFQDEVEALLPLMDRLESLGRSLFIENEPRIRGKPRSRSLRAGDLDPYRQSWFTVVTETEMSPRPHRVTEKPFKPLLAFHPFLVLGNPGSLGMLRGYGFETFSGVLDERYDEELDPRRRFDMVNDQVRRLCALDEAEMARMSAELSEIVTFNAGWGLTELPQRFSDTLVADLIGQLAPRGPGA
jgi:hypothetical protein